MNELKKLKPTFRKKGFDYEVIDRNEKSAIYEQKLNGKVVAYEVIKIRVRKYRDNIAGKRGATANLDEIALLPEYSEGYPSDNDWGRYGWTFKNLFEAMEKFVQVTRSGYAKV